MSSSWTHTSEGFMGCSACSHVAKVASKLGSAALLLISCISLRFAVPICFFQMGSE